MKWCRLKAAIYHPENHPGKVKYQQEHRPPFAHSLDERFYTTQHWANVQRFNGSFFSVPKSTFKQLWVRVWCLLRGILKGLKHSEQMYFIDTLCEKPAQLTHARIQNRIVSSARYPVRPVCSVFHGAAWPFRKPRLFRACVHTLTQQTQYVKSILV